MKQLLLELSYCYDKILFLEKKDLNKHGLHPTPPPPQSPPTHTHLKPKRFYEEKKKEIFQSDNEQKQLKTKKDRMDFTHAFKSPTFFSQVKIQHIYLDPTWQSTEV